MVKAILLTIDSLRNDHVDILCESAPELTEFTRFTNAYSHGIATPLSFPGLIAGHVPDGDGMLSRTAETIAEATPGAAVGYSNNPLLTRGRGYHRGFTVFDDEPGEPSPQPQTVLDGVKSVARKSSSIRRAYRWARSKHDEWWDYTPSYTTADDLSHLLLALEEEHQPTFLWGHYMDPHVPHTPVDIRDRDVDVEMSRMELEEVNELFHANDRDTLDEIGDRLAILRDLYAANIRFTGRQISTVCRTLRESGVYNDSLIAITADHGELFGEYGCKNHEWGADPVDELVNVPLLVKWPDGGSKTAQDHLVSHIDLHEVLKQSVTDTLDEWSLTHPREEPIITKSQTAVRAISQQGWYIKRRDGSEDVGGTISEALKTAAMNEEFPTVSLSDGRVPGLDGDTDASREQLEALGYL